MTPVRLLLVDDHPVVRAGYQRLLEQHGEATVVAQAAAVDEAVVRFAEHAPDLTITDLAMPGGGGFELIRRLRERRLDASVVVFSMHDGAILVRRAIELGARGFVSKTADPEALLDAVRRVAAGGCCFEAGFARPDAVAARPACFDALTDREFEIFRLLAGGDSAAACARSLRLSPKTVANHQSAIRDKLGVATSAAMAHLAIRHGLMPAGGG